MHRKGSLEWNVQMEENDSHRLGRHYQCRI
jgi:hypothetical protein